MKGMAIGSTIYCDSEYSPLKRVIVVKPAYMRLTEVINETQRHYEGKNIDIDIPLALKQHEAFINVLQKNEVEVIELPVESKLPEQVFTRDIAFTIQDQLFVASMNEDIRQEETAIFRSWLDENSIPHQEELPHSIEGGDVIVDGSTIWIGRSGRTSSSAIAELDRRLPSCHVQPLILKEDILHLDCVFNIISNDTALVYPPAFQEKDLRKIESRFEVIPVTKDEQFDMGPNVLSIGDKKVISLTQNERLNQVIQSKGFQVIPVDFSEIIKSGGSFRCCSLPLHRK